MVIDQSVFTGPNKGSVSHTCVSHLLVFVTWLLMSGSTTSVYTKRPHLSDSSCDSPVAKPSNKKIRMGDDQYELIISKLDTLQQSVDTSNQKLESMRSQLDETTQRLHESELALQNMNLRCEVQQHRIKNLENRVELLESVKLRSALIISGIKEQKDENCEQVVREIMVKLGIQNNDHTLVYAYRLGRYIHGNLRPIKVEFHHQKDRDLVWAKRKDLDEGIYFKPSYPPSVYRKRRILQAICSYAEVLPQYTGTCKVTPNHELKIGKLYYDIDNLQALPHDLQKAVGSQTKKDVTLFYGMQCPLSNFYPAKFEIDGIQFSSTEQHYYYCKAKYYSKAKAMTDILAEDDPVKIKKLGKAIGEKDSNWNKKNLFRLCI